MWIFALLVAVPLIEIALFIKVGGWLTLWPTLGIVVITAIIGSALMRAQGLRVLSDLRQAMAGAAQPDGRHGPANPLPLLAHGALILIAGILLMTPGFFTDTIGFLLLIPRLRGAVIAAIASRVHVQTMGFDQSRHPARDDVIDGDFIEIDEDSITGPQKPGTSGWTRH